MTYYLLINEDSWEIGDASFNKFYAYDGWYHLNKMIDKILIVMGYIALTVALIGLIGFVIECQDPEFTPFGKLATGAFGLGVYLLIFGFLRNETKELFMNPKDVRGPQ